MAENAKTMVKFKHGVHDNFTKLTTYDPGTIYITTDEQGIYYAPSADKAIKLGNIITYSSLADWKTAVKPPYSSDVFYYISNDNALIKFDTTSNKFVQLNKDYGAVIGTKDSSITQTTLWDAIKEALTVGSNAADSASAAGSAAADASALADKADKKADANANNISTLSGRVDTISNNLTTTTNTANAVKDAIEDSNTGLSALDTKITTLGTTVGDLEDDLAEIEKTAGQGVTDAATAKGIADEALELAQANAGLIGDANDGLRKEVNALTTAVDNLQDKDTELGNAIGGVEDKADQALERVGEVETDLSTNYYTKNQVDAIKNGLISGTNDTASSNTIAGAKLYAVAQAQAVDDKVTSLGTTVAELTEDIGSLSNIMNFRGVATGVTKNDNGEVTALAGITNPVAGDVAIYDSIEYVFTESNLWEPFGAATATETRFETIESNLEGVTGRVEALETTVNTATTGLKDKVTKLDSDVADLDERLEKAEGDIEVLTTAVGAKNDAATKDTVYGAINKEIARATAAEGALQDAIDALDGAYKDADNELSSKIDNVETAYKNADKAINETVTGINGRLTTAEGAISTITTNLSNEITRATNRENTIESNYKDADIALRNYIDGALAWGEF